MAYGVLICEVALQDAEIHLCGEIAFARHKQRMLLLVILNAYACRGRSWHKERKHAAQRNNNNKLRRTMNEASADRPVRNRWRAAPSVCENAFGGLMNSAHGQRTHFVASGPCLPSFRPG